MKKHLLILFFVVFGFQAQAQWVEQASRFPLPGIGVADLDAVDADVAWAIGRDMSMPGAIPVQYFTRTQNGGTLWQAGLINNAGGMNLSSISAVDNQTAWVSGYDIDSIGNTSGRIFKTEDGGGTWVHQVSAEFPSPLGFINQVHFFDANNGLAIGNVNGGYFEIYTTTNGGSNWVRVPQANIPAAMPMETGYINVFSAVGDRVWFGTTEARVFRSTDKGLNWDVSQTGLMRPDSTLPVISNLDFRNNQVGLIHNDSMMQKSIDGGLTWTLVNTSGPIHNFDLKYVTGSQQTWISTGANVLLNDIGSSISYNDGQDWVSIEDTALHTVIDFVSEYVGWSGGLNSSSTEGGMYKWLDPTSSAPQLTESGLYVYPNPARETITIRGLQTETEAIVELVDMLGRIVLTQKIVPQQEAVSINLSSAATGIHYLLIRQNNDKDLSRHKILIR